MIGIVWVPTIAWLLLLFSNNYCWLLSPLLVNCLTHNRMNLYAGCIDTINDRDGYQQVKILTADDADMWLVAVTNGDGDGSIPSNTWVVHSEPDGQD